MVITVMQYSPQSASEQNRIDYISCQARAVAVEVLIRTQRKSIYSGRPIHRYQHETHTVFSWGWHRTTQSNKAAGRSFMVRGAAMLAVTQVYETPPELSDRLAGLRLKGVNGGVAFFAASIPPHGSMQSKPYALTLDTFVKWLRSPLNVLGHRSMPFLCMDMDVQLGWVRTYDGGMESHMRSVVGPYGHGVAHLAAKQVRAFDLELDLCAMLTQARSRAPFYRAIGIQTYMDQVVVLVR